MSHEQLLQIGIQKRNGEIADSWSSLAEKHSNGFFSDGESYRMWVKNRIRSQDKQSKLQSSFPQDQTQPETHKDSVEISKDGIQTSNRLIRMSIEESKDVNYLLAAHGYDKDAWELVNAKSNIWNTYSKQDGINTLYSSKITVKPLSEKDKTFDNLIESIINVKPIIIHVEEFPLKDKYLLEIPLFDTHFGISDYEYYKSSQSRLFNRITSKRWEKVLFVVGQDMFHNDDFRGRTSSGTQIETVDMVSAWENCRKFYEPLIETAIKNSNAVEVIYSKGNHDESISWAFTQMLKVRFPSVNFDDSFIERKARLFGDNFIGITHGDKAKKNLHNIFPIEFPMMWAQAKNREIHTGHFHMEDGKDLFGVMVRTLCTRNKTDKWHFDNGFVGAHKRFMLFEYSQEDLESIYYV